MFDLVASVEDVAAAIELEMLTNERLAPSPERLAFLPQEQWLVGVANASIVMAAYLHADESGGRFTDGNLGAWYCSFDLQTAIRETVYHHVRRLSQSESGFHHSIQMRELRARVDNQFDDIRTLKASRPELYHADSYTDSQPFGVALRAEGSNGICYDSVRHDNGTNLVIYRPTLVLDIMQGDHFQYDWTGTADPIVSKLTNAAA